MNRSRRRRTSSSSTLASIAGGDEDELVLVKAAAWAWYQHGSGANEARAARESELVHQGGRARARRPSRYKLEALADVVASEALKPRPAPAPVTLLDVYEVERIKEELDRLATFRSGSGRLGAGRGRSPGKSVGKDAAAARRGAVGFWGRHAMGLCGMGGGVVEASSGLRRRKAAAAVSPAMASVV